MSVGTKAYVLTDNAVCTLFTPYFAILGKDIPKVSQLEYYRHVHQAVLQHVYGMT
jgi:hypothetical protein